MKSIVMICARCFLHRSVNGERSSYAESAITAAIMALRVSFPMVGHMLPAVQNYGCAYDYFDLARPNDVGKCISIWRFLVEKPPGDYFSLHLS